MWMAKEMILDKGMFENGITFYKSANTSKPASFMNVTLAL